jgi:hypothetical protein
MVHHFIVKYYVRLSGAKFAISLKLFMVASSEHGSMTCESCVLQTLHGFRETQKISPTF